MPQQPDPDPDPDPDPKKYHYNYLFFRPSLAVGTLSATDQFDEL